MASESSSGIQYALTALGVGMLALGILMMVWSVVPGFGKENGMQDGNSSSPTAEGSKHKVSQVSYILCAGGVFLLLVAICLSVRDKKRRRTHEEVVNVQSEATMSPEREEDNNHQLAVPSYDEVMQRDGIVPQEDAEANQGGQNIVSLPSYESLVEVGLPSSSNEVSSTGTSAEPKNERPSSRLGRRFNSKKIRRIFSDKSHLKNFRLNLSNVNNAVVNLEPLTPPPQYEEGVEKNFETAKHS
ncbi:transmembrane protein 51a [Narcine bancroftii]|uniref:transmembrane protein 51a n=1 Tax=Narcine bancroftii TaxID=1343680 RepID=UPI00383201FB